MNITVDIKIDKPKELVWEIVTDIENCQKVITSIKKINVLNKPSDGLVGLKWEETREMFGKDATETMWITEAEENHNYSTRAESHGSVYLTKLNLTEDAGGTTLTMSFSGIPQTTAATVLSFIMRPFINKSIKNALTQDLEDIKTYAEKIQSMRSDKIVPARS